MTDQLLVLDLSTGWLDVKSRVRKNNNFEWLFYEKSKHFLIFTKISNKFGEFLNFLGLSKIFLVENTRKI